MQKWVNVVKNATAFALSKGTVDTTTSFNVIFFFFSFLFFSLKNNFNFFFFGRIIQILENKLI